MHREACRATWLRRPAPSRRLRSRGGFRRPAWRREGESGSVGDAGFGRDRLTRFRVGAVGGVLHAQPFRTLGYRSPPTRRGPDLRGLSVLHCAYGALIWVSPALPNHSPGAGTPSKLPGESPGDQPKQRLQRRLLPFPSSLLRRLDHRPPAPQLALLHAGEVRHDHAHVVVVSGQLGALVVEPLRGHGPLDHTHRLP